MSYEEEIIVLIAQIALMKKRVYELRQRAMNETRNSPQRHVYKQATDELIRILCGLTSVQVRLSVAQYSFSTAKAMDN